MAQKKETKYIVKHNIPVQLFCQGPKGDGSVETFVESCVANMCETIYNLVQNSAFEEGDENAQPIPIANKFVTLETLKVITEFCQDYVKKQKEIDDATQRRTVEDGEEKPSNSVASDVSRFKDDKPPYSHTLTIMMAANYLNCKPLVELCATAMAKRIDDSTKKNEAKFRAPQVGKDTPKCEKIFVLSKDQKYRTVMERTDEALKKVKASDVIEKRKECLHNEKEIEIMMRMRAEKKKELGLTPDQDIDDDNEKILREAVQAEYEKEKVKMDKDIDEKLKNGVAWEAIFQENAPDEDPKTINSWLDAPERENFIRRAQLVACGIREEFQITEKDNEGKQKISDGLTTQQLIDLLTKHEWTFNYYAKQELEQKQKEEKAAAEKQND